MDTKLRWTREKPVNPDYYWVKCDRERRLYKPRVLEFIRLPSGEIEPIDGPLSTIGWDWFSGPVPIPEHQAV